MVNSNCTIQENMELCTNSVPNSVTNSVPTDGPKKRGRKKKIVEPGNNNISNNNISNGEQTQEMIETLQIEQVKKKRGRKKKWEVETTTKIIQNNPITFSENTTKNVIKEIDENYESENILFGNLNIKVHTNKEPIHINDIKDSLNKNTKNDNQCKINLSNSDYDDSDDEKELKSNKNTKIIIEKNYKVMKYHQNEFDAGNEIIMSINRCYNCHHTFKNKPFFLPIDYSQELKRFKVTGNFCSPNCVKAYGINSPIYSTKVYLIGHMYRKLFGANYTIKPAPPIQCLKDYGGFMTINEYRASFDNDKVYSLKSICTKIMVDEIIR